jgi:hypothetical protein
MSSGSGQKRKYSLRADDVCCGPDNGHTATIAACPFRADTVAKVEKSNDAENLAKADV